MSLNERKKQMIDKIIIGLQAEGRFIQQDETKSSMDKLMELDVLLDTVKFLEHYEQNTKILNKYLQEHRFEIKEQQEKERQQTDTKEKEIE